MTPNGFQLLGCTMRLNLECIRKVTHPGQRSAKTAFQILLTTLAAWMVCGSPSVAHNVNNGQGVSPLDIPALPIRMASLSYIPVKWDKAANLETIERLTREAAATAAQLVVTPEGGLEGYLIDELLKSLEADFMNAWWKEGASLLSDE